MKIYFKKSISLYLYFLIPLFPYTLSAQDSTETKKFYYSNGKVSSEGTMRNGKPDGYWKTYYETGILKAEGNRKNHELDSAWKFYSEDGPIAMEINYLKGKKNGYRKTY